MALATRCPSCSTVFRIGTAQAAAKGGMVRCGQCRDVFNSLDALVRVEDLDVIGEVQVGAQGVAHMAAAGALLPHDEADPDTTTNTTDAAPTDGDERWHETVVAIESPPAATIDTPADDRAEPRVGGDADAPDGAATASSQDAAAIDGPWWLPDPNQSATPPGASTANADAVADAVVHGPASVDESGSVGATPEPAQSPPAMPLSGRRTDLQWDGAAPESTNPTFMRPDAAPPPSGRAGRWLFGALSSIAVVALLGQAAHTWRDELAVRWSPAARWLTAACVPLRCTVDYPEHLDAISIESAAVQESGLGPDVYVMTALLRNREALDVRYPHLELVLTDVQDRPVLRRALRPEDYLPPARSVAAGPGSGFAAQSELPVRVMFELSGLRFAGYRLDRFYP